MFIWRPLCVKVSRTAHILLSCCTHHSFIPSPQSLQEKKRKRQGTGRLPASGPSHGNRPLLKSIAKPGLEIEGFGARIFEIRRESVCLGFRRTLEMPWLAPAVSLESDRCSHSGAMDENATGGGVGIRLKPRCMTCVHARP